MVAAVWLRRGLTASAVQAVPLAMIYLVWWWLAAPAPPPMAASVGAFFQWTLGMLWQVPLSLAGFSVALGVAILAGVIVGLVLMLRASDRQVWRA